MLEASRSPVRTTDTNSTQTSVLRCTRIDSIRPFPRVRGSRRRDGSVKIRRPGGRPSCPPAWTANTYPKESGRDELERLFKPRSSGSLRRTRTSRARTVSRTFVLTPRPAGPIPENGKDRERGTGARMRRHRYRRLHVATGRRWIICRPPTNPFGVRRLEPRPFEYTVIVCNHRRDRGRLRRPTKADRRSVMILPQVHLRKPCYDFYFL